MAICLSLIRATIIEPQTRASSKPFVTFQTQCGSDMHVLFLRPELDLDCPARTVKSCQGSDTDPIRWQVGPHEVPAVTGKGSAGCCLAEFPYFLPSIPASFFSRFPVGAHGDETAFVTDFSHKCNDVDFVSRGILEKIFQGRPRG